MENPDSPEFPVEVGLRLRTWRRSLRKTQDEMAAILHVNPTGYRRYELGRNAPGAAVLAAACSYGLNLNWLLTGRDHMLLRDEKSGYSADDFVLDRLCTSLDKLRSLDPEKFKMLSQGFIARSDEAGDHAQLKRNASQHEGQEFGASRFLATDFGETQFPPTGFQQSTLMPPVGFEDILSPGVDILIEVDPPQAPPPGVPPGGKKP